MMQHQTSTAVWKAVLSLPEHYREVVVLCDLQGMSYADAAEAVHCASAQCVRVCIAHTTCWAKSCSIRRWWLTEFQVLRRGACHDMP